MIKKFLKIILSACAGLLVLVTVILLLLQTAWFRNVLKSYALDKVNSGLMGRIETGQIRGNLFSGLEVLDVVVTLHEDTLILIPRVRLDYSLMGLLSQRIDVKRIVIESPNVTLVESQESNWTILEAFASTEATAEDNVEGKEFPWVVLVEDLEVTNASVQITSAGLPPEVPREASGMNLKANLSYADRQLAVRLVSGEVVFYRPDLTVRRLECSFFVSKDSLSVQDLALYTLENSLEGDIALLHEPRSLQVNATTGPVRFAELRGFIGDVDIGTSPSLKLNAHLGEDTLSGRFGVKDGDSGIDLAGWLVLEEDPERYHVRATVQNFDPALVTEERLFSPLTGILEVRGKGLEKDNLEAVAKIRLGGLSIGESRLDSLILSGSLSSKALDATLSAGGGAGYIDASIRCEDPFSSRRFSVIGKIQRLDISSFADFTSDVTARFAMEGSYPVDGKLRVRLRVQGDSLVVGEFAVDTLLTSLELIDKTVKVDSMIASGEGGKVQVTGMLDLDGGADLRSAVTVHDWSLVERFTGMQRLSGTGKAEVRFMGDSRSGAVELGVRLQRMVLDSITVGDLALNVAGEFLEDSALSLSISQFHLVWNDDAWVNEDTISFEANDAGLSFGGIKLVCESQSIIASGSFGEESSRSLSAVVRGLDIDPILGTFTRMPIEGKLDADLSVRGANANPKAIASVSLHDFQYQEFPPLRAAFAGEIEDSLFTYRLDISGQDNSVQSEGTIPVLPSGSFVVMDPGKPFDMSIATSNFDLAPVNSFMPEGAVVSGTMNGTIGISGAQGKPSAHGSMQIANGAFRSPAQGIAYDNIQLQIVGQDDALRIGNLNISSEGGNLSGSGEVRFILEDSSWLVKPEIRLSAKGFQVTNTVNHAVTVSGEVDISRQDHLHFDGRLTIDRSRFYLPAFANTKPQHEQNPPLLVLAARQGDSLRVNQTIGDSTRKTLFPFIQGRAVIDIPRGTWLRGPRIDVELRGNIEAVKDSHSVRVKGFLGVERGTYEFYGKKFVVTEGRLDFDGGEKIDPVVFLKIEHTIKHEEGDDLLEIQVRGPASQATLEFFHNRDMIPEADAVSYILFGKKRSELSYGEKTTMGDVGNVVAKDFAASLVNAQLSSSVGATLGLDVVKVSGEDNWNKATLTAGKYVTDDIYVSYERGITQSGSSSVLFESALLEYYLARFIYLRFVEATDKTSGVDLLLRFE